MTNTMSPTAPASHSSPKQPLPPSALLQEMLILAQSISSSAQYVTLKKDFLTSKFSYSLFFEPQTGTANR